MIILCISLNEGEAHQSQTLFNNHENTHGLRSKTSHEEDSNID